MRPPLIVRTGHRETDIALDEIRRALEEERREIERLARELASASRWTQIGPEIVVKRAAVPEIAGPVLDGDAMGEVMIEFDWRQPINADTRLVVRPNNVAVNLFTTRVLGTGSSVSAVSHTNVGLEMGRVVVAARLGGEWRIWARTGAARVFRCSAGGETGPVIATGGNWSDTAERITALRISARNSTGSLVNGIGVGSRFRYYRRTS
jgi:hypothetical protein